MVNLKSKKNNKPVIFGNHFVGTGQQTAATARASIKSKIKTPASFLGLLTVMLVSVPAHSSEAWVEAAKHTVDCKALRSSELRLACFDAATERLAEVLDLQSDSPTKAKKTEAPKPAVKAEKETADAIAVTPKPTDPIQVPPTPAKKEAEERKSASEEDTLPTWAAGPQFDDEDKKNDVSDFEAMIVRITVNSRGKHTFYTEDGAVWEQTQRVKIVPPRSLPAKAEFRRRMTGSPTISFDVSSQSYRVRRIK